MAVGRMSRFDCSCFLWVSMIPHLLDGSDSKTSLEVNMYKYESDRVCFVAGSENVAGQLLPGSR